MRYVETVDVPTSDPAAFAGNPRVHDEALLDESAATNGQYRSIVARRREDGSLQVLAGHGTREAFRRIGSPTVRVEVIECDDEEARRIVLVDNRANDRASYDERALLDLLKAAQPDLSGTGFDQDAFDALVASLWEPMPAADPDDAPPLPADPVSQPGDLWVLGAHRLVCGDSTDRAVAERVMDGDRADCVWTDPPYGVDYVGKTKAAMTIKNDGAAGLDDLLRSVFAVIPHVAEPGAPIYVAGPPGPQHRSFVEAFHAAGWRLHQNLIWVKDVFVLGRSDYHFQHEPILYGYMPGGAGRRGRGNKDAWFGGNAQSSVLFHDRPKRSDLHPTMKPVSLVVQCLNNSCRPGGVVFEPFGGSGTTLIAAHLTGRQARLVELDPAYVDVICRRFQSLTGTVPVLERTGEQVDFTAAPVSADA